MRLAVYCDGAVVVTTPYDLQESIADKFIREKETWLFSKIAYFKKFKGKPIAKYSYEDYAQYKDRAFDLAKQRVKYFSRVYGFPYNKINIKNQKTRWGSCSKKGNLNFNYRILFLPPRVQDYIIVHEMCHLKEFNHSRKFWNLVAKTFPNHKEIREELHKSGLSEW